jgi:hypothetical protein
LCNRWTEFVCNNQEISASQLVHFPQSVVWHSPHSALALSKYNPWAISVTRLPGAVHDKCLVLEECFPCHLLLLTPVWVVGSELWARSPNCRSAAFIMPDLWMCHLLWRNTQNYEFCIHDVSNKCAPKYIPCSCILNLKHWYVSLQNTTCACISFMQFCNWMLFFAFIIYFPRVKWLEHEDSSAS